MFPCQAGEGLKYDGPRPPGPALTRHSMTSLEPPEVQYSFQLGPQEMFSSSPFVFSFLRPSPTLLEYLWVVLEAHRWVQVPRARGQGHRQPTGTLALASPGTRPMDPLVLGHGRLLAKAPAALRTGVGALPAVGSPVGCHFGALPEAAPTVRARVGLLACVGAHVAPKV